MNIHTESINKVEGDDAGRLGGSFGTRCVLAGVRQGRLPPYTHTDM